MTGIEIVRSWLPWRNLWLGVGAALMLGAIACGSDEPEVAAAPPATAVPVEENGSSGGSPNGAIVQTDIAGFRLENLTIALGSTVTWTNRDNAPHTVSHGDSPSVDGSPEFRSSTFTKEGTFTHTFDTAGTFAYFCEVHPSMIASITVR